MNDLPCKHCGMAEASHHIYEPIEVPEGCVCEIMAWEPPLPPRCDEYVGESGWEDCIRCGHTEGCHEKGKP